VIVVTELRGDDGDAAGSANEGEGEHGDLAGVVVAGGKKVFDLFLGPVGFEEGKQARQVSAGEERFDALDEIDGVNG
jgi:hypothetical protein